MVYKNIPTTVYYLTHQKELDSKFPYTPIKKRMLICSLNRGRPKYSKNGTSPMQIFRKMFEMNLFREFKQHELNIISKIVFTDYAENYAD